MFTDLLKAHREDIQSRWLDVLVSTYPSQSGVLLRSGKDRFRNPVGHVLREGAAGVLDALIAQDGPAVRAALDRMFRIRAVQDFSPSQAVECIFYIKPIVREVLGKDPTDSVGVQEWIDFDAQVDRLALIAFDIYVQCREQLCEIRANEIRNRTHLLLERTKFFGNQSTEQEA